jgi:hypothetical protein
MATGKWDNWAQQTYDVFKSVMLRPRFSFELVKEARIENNFRAFFLREPVSGDIFVCRILAMSRKSEVSVLETPSIGDPFGMHPHKFKFRVAFPKDSSPPMRREALKCVKKMQHKQIFDAMMQ